MCKVFVVVFSVFEKVNVSLLRAINHLTNHDLVNVFLQSHTSSFGYPLNISAKAPNSNVVGSQE